MNIVIFIIFYFVKIHFTLKFLIFHMHFLINHMFRDIYRVAYQYFGPKVEGIIIGYFDNYENCNDFT